MGVASVQSREGNGQLRPASLKIPSLGMLQNTVTQQSCLPGPDPPVRCPVTAWFYYLHWEEVSVQRGGHLAHRLEKESEKPKPGSAHLAVVMASHQNCGQDGSTP